MKRLFYIVILSISLALFGCSDNVPQEQENITTEEVSQINVTMTITIPDEVESAESVDPIDVTVEQGETVIDVLENSGVTADVNGSGENAYVEGINDLYALDEGSASGWLVKVNGEFIDVGPGAYNVEEDDEIEWLYTTDFNKEFES